MTKRDFAIYPIRSDGVAATRRFLSEQGATNWEEQANTLRHDVVMFKVKDIGPSEQARLGFAMPEELWGVRGVIQ